MLTIITNDLNSGYDGYSMSVRAREAYASGEMPLSKWTKSEILNNLPSNLTSKYDFSKVSKSRLADKFLMYASYHHTSMCFNTTDFYCIDDEAVQNFTDDDYQMMVDTTCRDREMMKLAKKDKKEVKLEKVRINYEEWEGSYAHPHLQSYTEYGIKKGNWVYTESGKKKSLSGKRCYLWDTYKVAPKGTAQIFKEILKNVK